jgi:hypothetical protein
MYEFWSNTVLGDNYQGVRRCYAEANLHGVEGAYRLLSIGIRTLS